MNKRIIVSDFNIVEDLLSGKSLYDFIINSKNDFSYKVVFNKKCDLYRLLIKENIDCEIIRYGNSRFKLIRFFSLIYAQLLLFCISIKYSPNAFYANNMMASRIFYLSKFFLKIKVILHIRNPSLPISLVPILFISDKILVVSNHIKNNFVPKRFWNKTTVVYDGFPNRFKEVIKKIDNNKISIGMCSRITFQKGVHLFCELARLYPNIRFIHKGKSKFPSEISDYQRSLLNEFKNDVQWEEYSNCLDDFFSSIDIFILPAIEDEAFGRVLVEAMEFSIPCVTTKCGGPAEIVINEYNGLIAEPNLSSLKKCVDKLIANPLIYTELSKNSRDTFCKNYSLDNYCNSITRFF